MPAICAGDAAWQAEASRSGAVIINGASSEAAQTQAVLDELLKHELRLEPQHHEISTDGTAARRKPSKIQQLAQAGPRTAELMQAQVSYCPRQLRFACC